jgi:hypothetical protein
MIKIDEKLPVRNVLITEPPGGWDGLELESPKWRGTREDWAVPKKVVTYNRLKWAVFSFKPC